MKRWITMLAKKRGKHWYQVVSAVEDAWNREYISWLGVGPPNDVTSRNFDKVVEALYERDPMYMHSLYSVGHSMTEEEARQIFKFAPNEKVLVSMRTISKIIRNPVSVDETFSQPLPERSTTARKQSLTQPLFRGRSPRNTTASCATCPGAADASC